MTHEAIEVNSEILGGTPVFAGTRVPIQSLLEHLEMGEHLDGFLYDFPTVNRAQAVSVLQLAKEKLLDSADDEGSA